MSTSNSNVDPRMSSLIVMARGLKGKGDARALDDLSQSNITAGLITAYAAADDTTRATMVRHASGLHSDPKEAEEAYTAGWRYYRSLMREAMEYGAKIKKAEDINLEKYKAPEKAKDDTLGSDKRAEFNRLIDARIAGIKKAALVLVAFDHADLTWNDGDTPYVKSADNHSIIRVTIANARKLFPKMGDALDTLAKEEETEFAFVSIKGHMGRYRFSALETMGTEVLKANGVKKVAARKTADIQARRDALSNVVGIHDDDTKSYDEPLNESRALAAFVSLATALNDSTIKEGNPRFDTLDYTTISWITEGMAAVKSGQEASPQYKALRQFVSNMLDKNVPADKKAA